MLKPIPQLSGNYLNARAKTYIDWHDPELKARLIELYKTGASATQIQGALMREYNTRGVSLTRNAVLGVLHRLGLLGNKGGKVKKKLAPRVPNRPKRKYVSKDSVQKAVEARAAISKAKQLAQDIRSEFGEVENISGSIAAFFKTSAPTVSLIDLPNNGCRWPFECDDGSHRFCGEPSDPGSGFPYCTKHAGIAVSMWQPRRPATKAYDDRAKRRWA